MLVTDGRPGRFQMEPPRSRSRYVPPSLGASSCLRKTLDGPGQSPPGLNNAAPAGRRPLPAQTTDPAPRTRRGHPLAARRRFWLSSVSAAWELLGLDGRPPLLQELYRVGDLLLYSSSFRRNLSDSAVASLKAATAGRNVS